MQPTVDSLSFLLNTSPAIDKLAARDAHFVRQGQEGRLFVAYPKGHRFYQAGYCIFPEYKPVGDLVVGNDGEWERTTNVIKRNLFHFMREKDGGVSVVCNNNPTQIRRIDNQLFTNEALRKEAFFSKIDLVCAKSRSTGALHLVILLPNKEGKMCIATYAAQKS